MKEEWLMPDAVVPIDAETTAALVAEIKRLIGVVGDLALAQPEEKEWVGLSLFEQTHLRTTYALLKPLYHDIKENISVAAEVVADWGEFFAAIEAKLKEKNT